MISKGSLSHSGNDTLPRPRKGEDFGAYVSRDNLACGIIFLPN